MGKLYAIGDLHLGHAFNAEAWKDLKPHPDDGLILCGDVGESATHLELAFEIATKNFRDVWWCPGNHELYSIGVNTHLRGEDKYAMCVEIARKFGVKTPEDKFVTWEGEGGPAIVAPIFTLYDYTFRPKHMNKDEALEWAKQAETVATDEFVLHPDPFLTREDWCDVLIEKAERKLGAANSQGIPIVIVNHWPLREDLVFIPRVPRFALWCGTTKTENWHRTFENTKVVVTGHLHVPRTDWKDGVRFEECSLGYPVQWQKPRDMGKNINDLLREILPGPAAPEPGPAETQWRRMG